MGIIKTVFLGDIFEGLRTTLKLFFSKKITIQYPEKKWDPYPRFRGVPVLLRDEQGEEKCIACCLCASICPPKAITTFTEEGKDGLKKMVDYHLDIGRCIYCGLCEEICPVEAIVNSELYELACYEKKPVYYDKQKLLKKGEEYNQDKQSGGKIVDGSNLA